VFGRILSLLGNRKLNTSMDTLTTRYCRVAWLPSNHDRMVTWIRSSLLYYCVHVGCIATNSGKASVSIGTARCFKGKAIHKSELVSLWLTYGAVSVHGSSSSCEGIIVISRRFVLFSNLLNPGGTPLSLLALKNTVTAI
jgi:hypothetical protein